MLSYAVRRILISIPILVLATFLCFSLVTVMGDPLGDWKTAQPRLPSAVATEEKIVGYDQPFFERYGHWAVNFVKGDWNRDVVPGDNNQPVRAQVLSALGVTAKLVLFAELVAIMLGLLIGVVSAVRQYSMFDYSVTGIAFLLFSMPLFCIAIILKSAAIPLNNFLQANGFGRWITTSGDPTGGYSGDFWHHVYQVTGVYILPVLCLLAIQFAFYSRFQRGSMLEALNADYVRTARAKGISQTRVIFRHAFRNALLPVVTLSALNIGANFGGAIITETVFGWHGMGRLIVDAVNHIEPWMVLGWLVVTALFVIVFNLISDILYGYLDPRIRLR
ncbi:MAG TPA: ABC transporter permease [Pseudonocardiaceae bacterium]|jgi:peptide/nickel transport system permease protein|nr:ABC transporter permease [Pseudonocardiaceae bacterium]